MQKRLLVLLVLLAILSCKKNAKDAPKVTPTPDSAMNAFTLIPMDSVTWHVHCQGQMREADSPMYSFFYFDSTVHYYTTVKPLNHLNYSYGYMWYSFLALTTSTYGDHDTSYVYVREDTLNRKLYGYFTSAFGIGDTKVLADYMLNTGDAVSEFFRWPSNCVISIVDSVTISGQLCKQWHCAVPAGTSSFYQSYGIGWQMGILPIDAPFCAPGGEVRSLDFIYKSDSIHIDFPYY